MDVEEKCGNCKYWRGPWRPNYLGTNTPHEHLKGTCYRNPPIGTVDDGSGYWPMTWEYEWCGEYVQADVIVDLKSIR